MELLLQYPRPRKDEWIGSWIFRTARANEISLKQLFEHFEWTDTTDFPDEKRLLQLANVTRQPASRLEQMLKPQGTLIEFTGRMGGATIHTFMGIRFVQVCPICLSEDQVPHFRLSWLMRETFACPVHQTMMFDACPHCDARIMPRGARLVTNRREVDRNSRLQDDLRRCSQCYRDLGDPKRPLPALTRRLDVPAEKVNKQLSPTALEWSTLVEATRRLVDHDGLYQMLDLHTLTLRFGKVPLLPASRRQYATDHHFGRELMSDVLLGPRSENILTVHTRMRALGLWLSAIHTSPGMTNVSSARLFRMWIAEHLVNATEVGLLRKWPVVVNALLDVEEHKINDPRPVSQSETVLLQTQEWEVMSAGLHDTLSWGGIEKGKRQVSHQDVIQGFLWSLANNAGGEALARKGYADFAITRRWVALWADDGRLGIALGLLYRNMMQARKDIFLSPAEDPDSWHARTATIFLSNGMIELLRTVHPTLHRELLDRLVRRIAQARA